MNGYRIDMTQTTIAQALQKIKAFTLLYGAPVIKALGTINGKDGDLIFANPGRSANVEKFTGRKIVVIADGEPCAVNVKNHGIEAIYLEVQS